MINFLNEYLIYRYSFFVTNSIGGLDFIFPFIHLLINIFIIYNLIFTFKRSYYNLVYFFVYLSEVKIF